METLKERIKKKREEVSDRTYDSQREFADSDAVEDLREEVKILTARVDDTNHRINYHEAELNELNATMDIIIEAVEGLPELKQTNENLHKDAWKSIQNLAERLVHDEELIGIDDESIHGYADDCTIIADLQQQESDIDDLDAQIDVLSDPGTEFIDELRSEIGLMKIQFARKVDAMTDRHDKELVVFAKAISKQVEGLQEQINKNPEL